LYSSAALRMKKQYDLIVSFGEACSCTQCLRKAGMQKASYPYDWISGPSFLDRIKIFLSKFDRFFDKKDLKENLPVSSDCHVYTNTYNNFCFCHDFIGRNTTLENSYLDAYNKYVRRINRLFNNIQNSDNTLIVYMEYPINRYWVKITNEEIIKYFGLIMKSYKNIDLLYIAYDQSLKQGILRKEKLTENVNKWTGNYKSKNAKYDYEVDEKLIVKALSKFAVLKIPFTLKLKSIVVKMMFVLVNCLIPIRSWRSKIRNKLRKIKY